MGLAGFFLGLYVFAASVRTESGWVDVNAGCGKGMVCYRQHDTTRHDTTQHDKKKKKREGGIKEEQKLQHPGFPRGPPPWY